AFIVVTNDFATVFVNNSVADTQAQSCAFPDFFGGEERIEDSFGMRNSQSVIAEADLHIIVLAAAADFDARSSAGFPNCIVSVVQDVQEHLLQLMRVASDVRQTLIQLLNHFHTVALEVVSPQLHRAPQ